ncbi:Fc.00g021720.m01.CDS01 [Cosmosporella sp. VM-42]
MATQDLVDKLKETLGGGDSHPDHPKLTNQPQHQHVSENTRNENIESTSDEPQHSQQGTTTQKVRSLVEGVQGTSRTSTQTEHPSDPLTEQKNPRDAAHVPPSVLARHVGEPSIEHDFPQDSKTQRHSSVSHQEAHYNIG